MRNISYEELLELFVKGKNVDETRFYFKDDPSEQEHYIGFLPQYDKPYWAGYCDIEDGCEYSTALELFNAPIYDGLSIRERYSEIVFWEIGGISIHEYVES